MCGDINPFECPAKKSSGLTRTPEHDWSREDKSSNATRVTRYSVKYHRKLSRFGRCFSFKSFQNKKARNARNNKAGLRNRK
jgi:hypothetical protein